jgi:nitrogen fixation protein NifU and related proteins
MNDRLKNLYKTQILTYAKDSTHKGELPNATHTLEAYNPMCGDKYMVYLIVENSRVVDAKFKGYGCAISKASTAILVEKIIGKELSEVDSLVAVFLEIINADAEQNPEALTSDDALLAFVATREFPERKKCASLSWEAVETITS